MKFITYMLLGLLSCIQINTNAQGQLSKPLKARKQFVMPANLSANDYSTKTIVFKVKSQYRNITSTTKINNALLDQVLSYLGVNTFSKKFPKHNPPERAFNELGQAYADLSLIYELKYSNNIGMEDAVNQVLATNIMEFAEPHYIYKMHNFIPNDPAANSTSNTTGQNAFFSRIRAYAAWDLALGGSQGNSNVVIGIVDSGTDTDHPDLVTQFKNNTADPINGIDDDLDGYIDNYTGYDLAGADYNTVVGDNNTNIMGANNNHGSHVSGCASAATNNSIGVAGIGFNCKLLPVKCSADNDTRASGSGYIITGYEGITYAADHGAKIINCSWGGTSGGSFGQTVVDYATINKNCLVVASAGNSNLDEKNYPGSFNYVLSVAATNSTSDTKATFSTYNYDVDISTPGNNIYTTLYNNSYGLKSGTSMSSPITAGGAGLVQSKFNYTNALQIGQRLKQTSDFHYSTGTNITGPGNTGAAFQNKLGKGRMNLQRALTDPNTPSVVFANRVIVDNNDNAIVIGDSLFITGDFINYLSPTSNLTASITAVVGTAYVSTIDNNTSLGFINTLATANNNADPFKFKINTGTPDNALITFQVTLKDGTYTDKYFFDVIVNVDYVNIAINDVATTITSKGKIGYNADGQLQGLGFSYMGTDLLYEAGLMIGSSSSKVSDCFRGATAGASDADFQTSIKAYKVLPSTFSEFDVRGRFNDVPAVPTQSLLVTHNAYAWSTAGNRKYVIVEYSIKNTGSTALTNLYAGIAADWDIDATTSAQNKSDYVASKKMGYVYSTVAGGKFAGIKLLTNTAPAVCYNIDNTAGGGGGVDINDAANYYGTADKYTTLSTNRYQAGLTGTTGGDVIEVMSSGPFNIIAGDSVKVAFALIAGDNLIDITKSADSAQAHYALPVPTANFATAATKCVGSAISISDASTNSPTSYNWSFPGGSPATATTQSASVTYTAAGTYTITHTSTNASGTSVPVTQTISVSANPNITANSVSVCPGVAAVISASGATSYQWNTGATSSSISVTPTIATNYTVTGTNAAGCANTKTLSVSLNPLPNLIATSSTICAGLSGVLSASGANTYTWSNGATTSTVSVNPAISTNYTVTGASNLGCATSKTLAIIVNALPNVSSTSATICAGASGTLSASGASTYVWSTGATGVDLIINPTTSSNYTVTGTSVDGCVNSSTASISVGNAPSISVNSSTICSGSSATLSALGVTTYTWNTNSNTSNIVVNPSSTTIYTVTGNLAGCAIAAVQTATVNVNSLPVVSLSSVSVPICVNSATVALSGNPAGGVFSGTGVSGSIFDPAVSGAGAFVVSYDYTDLNSCTATASNTISVSLCTSIEELNPTYVLIYPNPVTNEINITINAAFSNQTQIELYDAIGKLIVTENTVSNNAVIDMHLLSSGLYTVRLISNGNAVSQRIIKN
ncbi:MAG: S8 family serine peptidase [Bacteroidia bacterium]|nr:S8 family serine peptidase [Bacteroidia bacterium]